MPSDEMRLFRQHNAAFLFKHAQRCNRIGHDRRLGIFGKRQVALRTFAHQTEQMLAKRIVHFLENLARHRARLGQ